MTRVFILAILFLGFGCSFKKPNKFSDPAFIQIADFQDKRLTDSLRQFLSSENAIYRKEAALAFASVQDTLVSSTLGNLLLEDQSVDVRRAAAYALGQTGGFLAVNSLIPASSDKDAHVVREVLEALGKTINKKDIEALVNFKAQDSLSQEGLSWGFYHLGLRGLADSVVIDRCKVLLRSAYSEQTRLGAAHFFNRSPVLPVQNYADELIGAAAGDPNVYVRMAATSGLRKINSARSLDAIKKIISGDVDYRVRCNAARALSVFPFVDAKEMLMRALDDQNINVQIAASELIKSKATIEFQDEILRKARTINNWRVQADLYEAALGLGVTKELIEEIKSVYHASTNDYQKSWLLSSLSKAVDAFPFVRDELFNPNALVVKSSAAQALVKINHLKEFPLSIQNDFSIIYAKAVAEGDPGVLTHVTSALSDSILGYREVIKDFNFLYDAKKKLSLPRDIEALQPLEEAIAYFEWRPKPASPKNEFNHPINWELAKSISPDQKVVIKTIKGDITLRLFIEEAPGSAINFLELCNQNYFDGKFFHRVVPNFVAQAGCNRGDGFGSEAYSIRSEFSGRRYTEGSVGMASAGKDTEGTQWFITHSPTPHLDGRYTIFAEVIAGMEVVHLLEMGDLILDASLKE